jgi:hypothetical protein
MKTFTHNCVDIREVCKHNNLDMGEVMDAICSSDVSFGSNSDTLISQEKLQDIVINYMEDQPDLNFSDLNSDILVSLGN